MKRGFTLVEMMVVVGIVVILIVLAVPNILRSRIIANEGVGLANLKAVASACQLFHINQERYPDSLSELAQVTPPYIDTVLATGHKQSFDFVYSPNGDGFTVNANPTGILKNRYFYTDQTDVIRFKTGSAAGAGDEIVR